MTTEIRRARTAFWWVGVIAPLALLVLAGAVVLAWFPELPDPVATHWGTGGVDGFGPRWTILIALPIGAGVTVLLAVLALFAHRMPASSASPKAHLVVDAEGAPRWSTTARFLGAVSLGLAGLMAFVTIVMAEAQRGLADASAVPDITPAVLLGFAVLVVLAVLGWFLQPRVRATPPAASGAEPVALEPTERAAWFGTVSIARGGAVTLILLWLLLAASTVFMIVSGQDAAASWILGATAVLVLLAIGATLVFRVRVGAHGLRVRSLIGWPNTRIALDDITKIEVAQVNPFAEFGGWGWRISADGRRGVVLRAGEALQVTRSNGRTFIVTVDGADEAAAVLAGLRAKQEHNGKSEGTRA